MFALAVMGGHKPNTITHTRNTARVPKPADTWQDKIAAVLRKWQNCPDMTRDECAAEIAALA